MLSMTSRGEKDGERKWQLQIPESLVATVYPEHSMPTQIEEQGPQNLYLTARTEEPRDLIGLSHPSHQL